MKKIKKVLKQKIDKNYKKIFSIFCSLLLIIGLIPVNNISAEESSYLPKTKEAEKVIVLDLSHDLKNKDGEAKEAYMAITSIQGIVNRESTTKIYLTHTPQEHDWKPFAADESYLEKGLIPVEKIYPSLDYGKKYPVLSYLLDTYNNDIKGSIQVPQLSGKIIDGAIMAGVTAAGVEDSILVSSGIEEYIENEGYSFEVKANTRGFSSNIDSFEWAYKNYFEKCNKTFAAQHTFTAFGGGMEDQFPIMYDYYISSQVFVFCLNGNDADELAKLQEFLVPKNYAPGTAVLGLPVDEGKGISCISDSGYYFAIMYVPNLTVTSSFKHDKTAITEPPKPEAVKTNDNTNYVAFFATDGDSMGFPTNFMYEHIINAESRGEVPIGWSYNPHLIDLFPTLLKFYSENDYNSFYEYVASMNNGGSPRNEEGANTFKNRYIDYVNKANGMFRTINYFNEDAYINDLTKAIDPYLLIKGYQGQTDGNDIEWGKIDSSNITFTTMSGATQGNAKTENIYKALKRISSSKDENKPTFTVICVGDGRWSEDPTKHVKEAIDKLQSDNIDQDFTFMRPSDLAATYKSYDGDTSVTIGNPKVVSFSNENILEKVTVDQTSVELVEKKQTSIKGFAMDAKDQYIPGKKIEYKSQDEEIVTVDSNGTITAKKEGATKITVSCENKSIDISVKVSALKPSSIAVDKTIFSTAVGGVTNIKAQLYDQFGQPLDASEFKWDTEDGNIASVNNGTITGLKAGVTKVTVSYDEIQTKIQVTVLESANSISRIIIDPSGLDMYENDTYSVSVKAYDKDNHEVYGFNPQWSIEDETIASINNGYITGIKSGKTKVFATFTKDVSKSINLTVKKDDRTKLTFDSTTAGEYVENFEDIVTFEGGSFKGYGKQGTIQGNAIKLDDERYEKAFTFKNKTVLKSIKAYNPTEEVITISLVGAPDGEMIYKIDPGKTLTLKTNWYNEKTFHVIKTTNTDVAFGEFVYGEAEPIPTVLKIDQSNSQISISKDQSLDLTASLYDQNNNKINNETIEWSTDRDDIVSVNDNGSIKGIGVGSTFIYAKAKGLVASVLVYVTEGNVDRIETSPTALTCYVGDIIPLNAKVYDKDNQELHFPLKWTSQNESLVSINSKNYAKALAVGTTQIKVNILGKESIIPVFIKDHPESDKIINFTQFNENDFANGLINERVTFENDFWKVKSNVSGITGNAVQLRDEQTTEKAFNFNTPTTVKSFKVHNPTIKDIKITIKTLDGSLPPVEHTIPAGETYSIYTGYKNQTKGYAFETDYQMLIGEIIYTDTLESGFTSQDISKGIIHIDSPKLAQEKLNLPKIDGFDLSIHESSHPDIINKDGEIDALGIDTDVEVILSVTKQTKQRNTNESAQTSKIIVKVLGIPSSKVALDLTIKEVAKKDLTLYTPLTVKKLNDELSKANSALTNDSLRQREVDEIKLSLETAINDLQKKADINVLQSLLEEINKKDLSLYTPNSLKQLNITVDKAKGILKDANVSQSDVDLIVKELNEGVSKLQTKAQKNELNEIYTKLESKNLSESSIQSLKDALSIAKTILDNDNATQQQVNETMSLLKSAQDKLVKKSNPPTIQPQPDDSTSSNVITNDNNHIYSSLCLFRFSLVALITLKRKKANK
ncbi:MAG: Ig-like domain-containing protein [Coprobacillus sp.]